MITAAQGNLITELDGEPALDVLLRDTGISLDEPEAAMAGVARHLGRSDRGRQRRRGPHRHFGADVVVRHIIGLDPARRGVAVADRVAEPACAWPSAGAMRRPRVPT